jgi:DNA repair protein RadC
MSSTSSLKALPENERPRERLLKNGPHCLSTVEIIAIILGSGTKGKSVLLLAQDLLSIFGSLEALSTATVAELCKIKGLGKAKSLQLKACFSLVNRLKEPNDSMSQPILTPLHAYLRVRNLLQNEKKEIFGVILQDVRNMMISWEVISIGTLTHTLVHPREVFSVAVRNHAASLILVHNHPSGDLKPSAYDIEVTRRLIEAGKLMGFPIRDHIIISSKGFISLREMGCLKEYLS